MTIIVAIMLCCILATTLLWLLYFKSSSKIEKAKPVGYHVVISGGSKGIGKALALQYAKLGAHVTIIARNMNDLKSAKTDIEAVRLRQNIQKISIVSLDLIRVTFPNTVKDGFNEEQQKQVDSIFGEHKKCDLLINCCGSSIPAKFQDLSQDDFKFMMDVNYFSAVNLTRLLLPSMKSCGFKADKRDDGPQIVFVSSICGVLSFYGFSAYAASKFALVGLAEAINMELLPFNISVTVAFPGDTDTPGYEIENLSKPALCKIMSETGNVSSADSVAASVIKDINKRKFFSTHEFENIIALSAANSFMPDTFLSSIINIMLAGPLRLVSYFVVKSWYSTVLNNIENERRA